MNTPERNDHWLVRRKSIRLLILVGTIVLGLTIALQAVVKVKGYFGMDGWFGFGALFGFLCCVLMVLAAKGLGRVLKRKEQYYDD